MELLPPMPYTCILAVRNSQCGFKCIRREAALALFGATRTDGCAFDVELLLLARQRGMRIREIPIDWHYRADSRLRPGRDGLAMARDVLALALRHRLMPLRGRTATQDPERSRDPRASSDCRRDP